MRMQSPSCHGLLLNGGKSSRLGVDKGSQLIAGTPIATRVARALTLVASPVLAVGREIGLDLPVVQDEGRGPLAAFFRGAGELGRGGFRGPILLVACDLPFITPALLRLVRESLGASHAAVPVQDGFDQPLAACYSQEAVQAAGELLSRGERSLMALIDRIEVVRILPEIWTRVAPAAALFDIDTPKQLEAARALAPSDAAN
jgi:molybdopterin-guanine dinucleotide biosynthesis protein A